MRNLAYDSTQPVRRLGPRWRWLSLLDDRTVMGVAFVIPALILLFLFLAYPLVLGIWLGFTNTLIG
ncbi:MAG: hypothetical protein ACM3N7_07675, partial [Planctomycetaceae bacterium]